jgi:hypothetical protein
VGTIASQSEKKLSIMAIMPVFYWNGALFLKKRKEIGTEKKHIQRGTLPS